MARGQVAHALRHGLLPGPRLRRSGGIPAGLEIGIGPPAGVPGKDRQFDEFRAPCVLTVWQPSPEATPPVRAGRRIRPAPAPAKPVSTDGRPKSATAS